MHMLVLHGFFYTIKKYRDQKKTHAYNIYTYMHEYMLFYMHLYKQTKQEQQSESKKLVIDCCPFHETWSVKIYLESSFIQIMVLLF